MGFWPISVLLPVEERMLEAAPRRHHVVGSLCDPQHLIKQKKA
jgi:hypothetical protein